MSESKPRIEGSGIVSLERRVGDICSSNKEIAVEPDTLPVPVVASHPESSLDSSSPASESAPTNAGVHLDKNNSAKELNDMIPRSKSPSNNAAVVATSCPSPGKDGSLSSTSTTSRKRGPLLSMELSQLSLLPEDVALDGGLSLSGSGPMFTTSDEAKIRLTTSDFVKTVILAEERQQHHQHRVPAEIVSAMSAQHHERETAQAMVELTQKLGRISTGEDIMTENIRLSSREWVGDFRDVSMKSIDPDLFVEGPQGISYGGVVLVPSPTPMTTPIDQTPPPPPQCRFHTSVDDFDEYDIPIEAANHLLALTLAPTPPLSSPQLSAYTVSSNHGTTTTPPDSTPHITTPPLETPPAQSYQSKTSSSSSTKSKKRRKRVIDETRTCEPTKNDVLFGRGGFTNTHPGNIKFRQTALELRPWYEASTKEEKYKISDVLVESVTSEGHRFLEKGKDGLWHEVIGNGARKKASQALRERVRRRNSPAAGSGLTESVVSQGSQESQGGEDGDVEGGEELVVVKSAEV